MSWLNKFDEIAEGVSRKFGSESSVSKLDIATESARKSEARRITGKEQTKYRKRNLAEGAELTDDFLKQENAAIQSIMNSPRYQKRLDNLAQLKVKDSTSMQAWLKTSRQEDGVIYQNMAGSAITGAAVAGIGSLFTDASFGDSLMMGGLTGGLAGGIGSRARTLRSNKQRAKSDQMQTGIDKRREKLSSSDSKRSSQLDKIEAANNKRLAANTPEGVNFIRTGTLAGAGSLAYATLASNNY